MQLMRLRAASSPNDRILTETGLPGPTGSSQHPAHFSTARKSCVLPRQCPTPSQPVEENIYLFNHTLENPLWWEGALSNCAGSGTKRHRITLSYNVC